ncbi:MAG TPA: pyrroline-5-carboxylate reductase [Xanthomonadales bacterium]|nr:pyrroline-5-carboxylate reductase [Xanthomonadales bacterium]
MNIAFIGGGNMATALIAGLLKSRPGMVSVRAADPSEEARKRLMREYGIDTYSDSHSAIADADVIVLAVKPQVMPVVLAELANIIEDGQLMLSIAAGTTVSGIQDVVGENRPVIRSMPNTPALIGHGVCGLYASANCKPHHRDQAEHIMRTAGEVVWVEDESLMDVITAVSGSGPAYYFLMTEALAAAGRELGLSESDAQLLAIHTAEGAGAMLARNESTPEVLRQRVTSPGGTTQAAIESMEANGFRDLMRTAVEAATRRGRELAG